MSRLPGGLNGNSDVVVEHIRDNELVHLPHGCPAAERIEGPTFGAYRVDTFSVDWCTACFPDEAGWRTDWPSNGGGYSSPRFSPSPSPSREVIPHAQNA